MDILIYRSSTIVNVIQPIKAEHVQKIMGDDYVSIIYTGFESFQYSIGDYIVYNGNQYFLNNLPTLKKEASNRFLYTMRFEGLIYDVAKVQYMLTGRGEFDLMGNALDFITLLVDNLNRKQSGWSVGQVDSTEYKNLHFSNENCLSILQKLAGKEVFDIEFYLSGSTGKEINFTSFGVDSGYVFQYGKGNGLRNIVRDSVDSQNIITCLYAFGSTKNLPALYRDSENLQNRLIFVDSTGNSYIEQNTELYGNIEFSKNFDEVYPHRTGTISDIDGELVFEDSSIDFDVNDYLLPETAPKVHFQTGLLGGYEFEIHSFDASNNRFTLKYFDDGEFGKLPNLELKPAIGDLYVLVDIYMPQSYIDAAETELLEKATTFLEQNSSPRVQYTVEFDPIHIQNEGIELFLGDYLTIIDVDMGVNKLIRITELTQDIIFDSIYRGTLSNTLVIGALTRMYSDSLETKRIINNPKIGLNDIFKTKKNWRTSEELRSMVFDADDYFDMENIRPLSIETSMLSVGSKSGDFVLNEVVIEPNYQNDPASVNINSGGTLVHFSISETIKTWDIAGTFVNTLSSGTAYYIYARCEKETTDGVIIFDSTQRKADSDETYYYFIIGVLHSVINGTRKISLTYGFTTINGAFITTGKIQDATGVTYFDLTNGEIKCVEASSAAELETIILDNGKLIIGYTNSNTLDFGATFKINGVDRNIELLPFEPGDSTYLYADGFYLGSLPIITWEWSVSLGAYIFNIDFTLLLGAVPTYDAGLPAGTVYKDGSNFLKVM